MTSERKGFCYVIMAHHEPDLLVRLIGRLRALSPDCHIVVRHDRGAGFLDESLLRRHAAEEFRSEIAVSWGDWSMVLAMLEALDHASRRTRADWFVLLSGQDYPLRGLLAWEAEVVATGDDAWVFARPTSPHPRAALRWRRVPLSSLPLPRGLRRLLAQVFYRFVDPHEGWLKIWRLPHGLGWAVGLPRLRGYPSGLRHYQGSQWMTLSVRALRRLRTVHEGRADLRRYFATTFVPDESYLQTLLYNDSTLQVADRVTTHADFEDAQAHPLPLTVTAAQRAREAGVAFARKLTREDHPTVADALDILAAQDDAQHGG